MSFLIESLGRSVPVPTETLPKCPLCGSEETQFLYWCVDRMNHLPGKFSNVKCAFCGLVRLSERPTRAGLAYYYPEENYYSYSQLSNFPDPSDKSLKEDIRRSVISSLGYPVVSNSGVIQIFGPIVNRLFFNKATFGLGDRFPRYVQNGKVLDVGCGSGVFLSVLKYFGWNVWGVELSRSAAQAARDFHGIDVFVGDLCEAGFENDFFDYITFNHSLEHLPNTDEALAEARRILKPGGTIYIEVPNIESLSQRISGEFWLHWDCPRHLYGFSPKTLLGFIERNGFTSIKVNTIRADFYEADIKYKREDERKQKLVQTDGLSIADRLRAKALQLITSLYCKIYRGTGDYICIFARKEP